jgi:hypothetical protein
MGDDKVTVKNLRVFDIDGEKNIILIEGAVPGGTNAVLRIRKTGKVSNEPKLVRPAPPVVEEEEPEVEEEPVAEAAEEPVAAADEAAPEAVEEAAPEAAEETAAEAEAPEGDEEGKAEEKPE